MKNPLLKESLLAQDLNEAAVYAMLPDAIEQAKQAGITRLLTMPHMTKLIKKLIMKLILRHMMRHGRIFRMK